MYLCKTTNKRVRKSASLRWVVSSRHKLLKKRHLERFRESFNQNLYSQYSSCCFQAGEQKNSTPYKPMSHRERCFAQKHAIFLLRNINKVRQIRQRGSAPAISRVEGEEGRQKEDVRNAFLTQFTALKTARSVRTRLVELSRVSCLFWKIDKENYFAGYCFVKHKILCLRCIRILQCKNLSF